MKEKIKLLAEQCTTINDSTTIPVDKDFDYEKFAELIVRECVASIPSNGHRGDFGRAVVFCQQQIKQHFRVE